MKRVSNQPRRLGRAELSASLDACLADWNGRAPLWVFGYGSLIWRPELSYDRRAPARVHGYHRRLCLWSRVNRGTPDCPGLVAGLDRGGSCAGVVFRIPARHIAAQFRRLWQREMFMGSYQPCWLACRTGPDALVQGIAFVVRRDAPNYTGRLEEREILEVFARGSCGRFGTSLDYLINTVRALHEHGIADPHLERLARRAAARSSIAST
jgi:cation transport protein ChaC